MKMRLRTLALAGLLLVTGQSAVGAQEYKDKTLTIIVGYSPGGSFDLYARVLARYIGRYLPGNPTRIVENMTGAGGIIAANHLYNRVKPDGLTIGAWASPLTAASFADDRTFISMPRRSSAPLTSMPSSGD